MIKNFLKPLQSLHGSKGHTINFWVLCIALIGFSLIFLVLQKWILPFQLKFLSVITQAYTGIQWIRVTDSSYVATNAAFGINESCSGLLYTSFLPLLTYSLVYRISLKSTKFRAVIFCILCLFSYGYALLVNSFRITVILFIQKGSKFLPLDAEGIHSIFSILYFAISMFIFFEIISYLSKRTF